MTNNRDLWADNGKALAIWLMVFAHTSLTNEIAFRLICACHMPFFFFLSGYYDKSCSAKSWINVVSHSWKTLIIPYFFFSLFSLSICWISPYLHPELYPGQQSAVSLLKSAIVGMFLMYDNVSYGSFMPYPPLWFLAALFICKVSFSALSCKENLIKSIILKIGAVFLSFLIICFRIKLFSAFTAFICLPIYGLGYLSRRYDLVTKLGKNLSLVLLGCILLAPLYFFFCLLNGEIAYNGGFFGSSVFLFYVNADMGILFLLVFSLISERKGWDFSRVGSSTITILGTHLYLQIFSKVICVYFNINMNMIYSMLVAFLSCYLGCYIHKYILKNCPIVLGR